MAKKRKDYLDDYLEYDDFKYDYKSDPLYQAMKKQYLSEADRTAEDVLGKYAVSSGGGTVSSSAISAASNAANLQKSKLNEALPTLYDLAWEMYQGELDDKKNKYEALLKEDEFVSKNSVTAESEYSEEEYTENENNNYSDDGEKSQKENTSTSPVKPRGEGKKMDDGIFDMTKKLIENLVSSGEVNRAKNMYSMYMYSMSSSQRKTIEDMLA